MDLQLGGRCAIVTGASRGLGRAVVEAFATERMHVVAVGRDRDTLEELARQVGPSVLPVACDVSDAGAGASLVDRALEGFGRLDVVVNNAGVAPAAAFAHETVDHWRDVFAVNVFAPVELMIAAGIVFIEQQHGKVINVASTSGLRGKPKLAAYSSSKAAMLRLTEAVAVEWACHKIQVNAIAPGAFATDAQRHVLEAPDVLAKRLRKIPARRMGEPAEIAPLACYLASPISDFVTGAVYVIDGGEASKL
jgi:2-dehydro-3-deoxy-D-gluconate 5-dehydrogenase